MELIVRLCKFKVGAPILVAVLSVVFTLALPSMAQEPTNPITLSVSPQILDVTANTGERITNTFKLTNASQETLRIKTTAKNFTPNGEEGAVSLTEDDTTYSIAKWINVEPSTTTLKPNSSQSFDVFIDVPEDAEPGSHFGSVVFQTIPPEDEEAAALISQEIAPVMLVKVAGDVIESAAIEEFTTGQPNYSNQESIEFISRLKNNGSVHFKPVGQIVVKNMWGNEVTKIDLEPKNVLPDSVRKITSRWDNFGFLIGRYTAELTVVSGDSQQISMASTSFWVFPYQTILPIGVVLLVIAYLLFKGRNRLIMAAKALSGTDSTNSSSKKSDK
jgi:hypothetical protein